jgi:eukaryotic-like serine/threonine-protein kinase
MPLQPDHMLAHYRLVEKIGEGGMGMVWKALDTKLDRQVAIKVLPDAVAQDPDRLARFEREAKVLASLNHPNVAAIYGLEEAEQVRFLVLELVPGETLGQRISRGAMTLRETLEVGRQVASALEEAHENAVLHRDLKPANVMVTPDDRVKVLDFGLAKSFGPSAASQDLTQSPTVTSGGTGLGVIMGTATYMSPEQARGRALDRRTDIWSFGCLLYEALTGRKTFGGETL